MVFVSFENIFAPCAYLLSRRQHFQFLFIESTCLHNFGMAKSVEVNVLEKENILRKTEEILATIIFSFSRIIKKKINI